MTFHRTSGWLAGGLLALLAAACQRHAVPTATAPVLPVETGVSQPLAEARRQLLSHLAYSLDLAIPSQKTQSISGNEVITFTLGDNRQPLQLDFKAPADLLRAVVVNGRTVPIDHRNEHLLLPARTLRVGRNEVKIDFTAGDQSLNRNDDYLYTLLVPDRARTVFPVFDQPDLKAVFTLSLTVPATWQAVANGPLRDSLRTGASKTYHFAPSDSISTYLFSFAAGKFQQLTRLVDGRSMSFLHRETDSTKLRLSVPVIFAQHGRALDFLQKYTGIPYPFQKFDFTAIPDFQYGGMEHVGAIDYKAASLFLDNGATRDQELARRNLINHETAHMWFGDLVTMRWFNDVWMKEVFANFMADKLSGGDENEQQLKFLTDHYPLAYAVDRTAGANAIRQPLPNLQNAGSLYGNIIYHKAPIMMRQLELLMGEGHFRDGVREYLQKYAHGNATWPDLIAILDAHTPADLAAWNQVWVNEPGRPVFSYTLSSGAGPCQLAIRQQAEDGSAHVWPQQFELITMGAQGQVARHTVQMAGREVQLVLPARPKVVLFNSDGLGYGVFPADTAQANQLKYVFDPVVRASLYISLFENMLRGQHLSPGQLLAIYQEQLRYQADDLADDLNIKLMTDQLNKLFWQFLTPAERQARAPALEETLWQMMLASPRPGQRKLYFRAYERLAFTPTAQARLYHIWQTQAAPGQRLKLAEEDYTSLALTLALRDYPAPQPILIQQLARIKNADRRQRLEFLMPALSPNVAVRDSFFVALKDEKNREKEAWVTAALGYLHHPLRQATSEKYLPESLALLTEIQATGDIFFPAAWLQSTLGYYPSATAGRTVQDFLAAHPAGSYNPQLRLKLLQAADDLLRAQKL